MTNELARALAVATYWRKHYDDCNPDVGMGPFIDSQIEDVLRLAQIPATQRNIQEVLETYRQKWGNN